MQAENYFRKKEQGQSSDRRRQTCDPVRASLRRRLRRSYGRTTCNASTRLAPRYTRL